MIKQKYFRYAKAGALLKATALKHYSTLTLVVAGFVWLVFFGIEHFKNTIDYPVLKIAGVILAYIATLTKIAVDHQLLYNRLKRIKRKLELKKLRR